MTGSPTQDSGVSRTGGSSLAGALRFSARHRARIVQLLLFAVVAIVVAQNMESTSVDVLFWSITSPKLVLIVISMLVGAAIWEIVRRSRAK
jgi:uncharacterized integral membrane protein